MVIDEIRKIGLEGDILYDENTLAAYSKDASVFEIKPEVVVYPKNKEDLRKLVNFTSDHKNANPSLSLTPRSAGTDMSGGSINDSIILDFTRYFTRCETKNGYANTEPGVYYRDFET